jgi:hypothetical protein
MGKFDFNPHCTTRVLFLALLFGVILGAPWKNAGAEVINMAI